MITRSLAIEDARGSVRSGVTALKEGRIELAAAFFKRAAAILETVTESPSVAHDDIPADARDTVRCSCGCGAMKTADGRCECGQALGHR